MEDTNSATKSALRQVGRKSLRHTVRDRIEQAIIQGEFTSGERLNEAELSRVLGVSRGLVREVIRELEASGILVNVPYRGSFVKEWSPRSVRELYTLRSTLEGYAAQLAAECATDEDLQELRDLLEAMRRAARADDVTQLVQHDLEFHQRLWQTCDHGLLAKVLSDLSGQAHMFMMATKAYYSPFSTLEEAADTHEPILAALEVGDSSLAREAINEHISEVGERYVQHLESSGLHEYAPTPAEVRDRI